MELLPSSLDLTTPDGPNGAPWWSKLLSSLVPGHPAGHTGGSNKRSPPSWRSKNLFTRSGRRASLSKRHSCRRSEALTKTDKVVCADSLSSPSTDNDDDEDDDTQPSSHSRDSLESTVQIMDPSKQALERVHEQRNLLEAKLRLSRGANDGRATQSKVLIEGPLPLLSQPERASKRPPEDGDAYGGGGESFRRSRRSPVLPVSRPWDPPTSDSAVAIAGGSGGGGGGGAGGSGTSSGTFRHRYDGDFCCPKCEEIARAEAEEIYNRATWRMYDRITRARAAAAAIRAAQMQQQMQWRLGGGLMCLPVAAAADPWVPPSLPSGTKEGTFEKKADSDEHSGEYDDAEIFFPLEMDEHQA